MVDAAGLLLVVAHVGTAFGRDPSGTDWLWREALDEVHPDGQGDEKAGRAGRSIPWLKI